MTNRIIHWFFSEIVYRLIIIVSWVFNRTPVADLWEGLKHPPEEPFS